jgi:hypothetical protein
VQFSFVCLGLGFWCARPTRLSVVPPQRRLLSPPVAETVRLSAAAPARKRRPAVTLVPDHLTPHNLR